MSLRIAIVGGGIGGLAAALFLRRAGIEATVYEQAPALVELGAGIVVAPNMVRLLRALGLGDDLADCGVRLDAAWEFRRWRDGRVLFVQAMDECERLYGAPCYVAHRADLIALLGRALPPHQLRLDHLCVGLTQRDGAAEVDFARRAGGGAAETAGDISAGDPGNTAGVLVGDKAAAVRADRARADRTARETITVTADAVIGADGIHSAVRPAIGPDVVPRFSGMCAFRCLVPADRAPELAQRTVQSLWVGPGRHFVHYPISGGRLINVVAIVPAGDWRTESWTADGAIPDLLAEFADWDPRLAQLISGATTTKRWAMYDREPLERWTRGRITLLGDAAHAMLPYFAQGAAQAVEDAAVLAGCLRDATAATIPEALQRYEAIRRPRTSQVQLMSRGRELANHLPDGAEQEARDAQLASGQPLLTHGWLYGHDIDADLRA
jgi:salicylate hydroxylase